MKRFILLFLTLLIVHSFVFAQNNELGINKIVIDPGHGGKDPGNGGTGRYHNTEKDVVLDISLLLGIKRRELKEILYFNEINFRNFDNTLLNWAKNLYGSKKPKAGAELIYDLLEHLD